MKLLTGYIAAIALALAGGSAAAAEFCVTTSTELKQALMTAGSNGEADTIKIETGTYASTGGSAAFAYTTSENSSLSLQGGWVSNPPALCVRQVQLPAATILSGSDARQVLKLSGAAGTSGGQSISNLTLRDGLSSQPGAGLSFGGGGGFLGNIVLTRV
ncbi:MAG: hypothetical protein ABIS07_00910, partial [Dokdonella sp.]